MVECARRDLEAIIEASRNLEASEGQWVIMRKFCAHLIDKNYYLFRGEISLAKAAEEAIANIRTVCAYKGLDNDAAMLDIGECLQFIEAAIIVLQKVPA